MKCFKNIFGVLLCMLMLMPAVALAENKLTFEPFTIRAGETKQLVIDMVNDKDITLVQFDLRLPEGLSVTYNEEDEEYNFSKTSRAHSSHTVSSNKIGNVYSVLLSSQGNKNIKLNEGAVITVEITAASTFKTGTITLENIELSSNNETAVYPADVSLDITLPKVTVTITDAERKYGEENPQFTYTASTDDDLTGLVTLSCEATTASGVGEYPITGVSTATDLEVEFVNGKLTVKPAALTVTADDKSKVFGGEDPALTYSVTGLVNGDQLTGSLARAEGDAVGTYAIGQGTLTASSNYALTFNGANFTITAKAVASPTIELSQSLFDYDGTAKEPVVTVKDGTTTIATSEYTVSYSNNMNAGTATVTITDKEGGNYTVSGTTTFTIQAKSVTTPTIELGTSTIVYDGTAKEPGVTVKDGTATIPSSEYTVSYSNNTNAGTATITITDKDSGNYTVSGSTTFTITAKSVTAPTIELGTSTIVYDGTAKEPGVTVKDGTTTIPSSEYTISYSNNTNAGTATVAITDKDGGNYTVSGSTTFTIAKAELTATADAKTRKYGQGNPEFTITYSGFLNGDNEQNLKAKPTATTTATTTSSVGSYDISLSGGEAQNYDLNLVNGMLTVTKATLKATAQNASSIYGDDIPTFTVNYEGFVNGEDKSVLTSEATATTEATKTSNAGTYPIAVSGGEATNYQFSEYVSGTLTITQAPLTVKAKDAQRYVGDENPTFELEYTGFKNADTESVLTTQPTATTEATKDSPKGAYPIVVSGGEAANYTLSYQNGTLTVAEKGTITITATNVSRAYGDANPTLEYTVIGDNITGTPSLTCEAVPGSPVGEYVITVTKGTITNDANFDFHNGTLTVTPAPLTVTASATRTYGAENPAFTLSYEGFKNGEDENVLTTKPTAATEATATSAVGTYPVTVSGGEAQNYAITYSEGTLTVTKAPLTVTATDVTRSYGQDNPTFAVTYSGFLNDETVAVLKREPAATTTATKMSDVGTYAITVTGGESENYELTAVSGTLTVTKATLKAKVQDAECEYGTLPTFTIAYEGFINGDNESEFTTAPVAQTAATATSPVGVYDVTLSGGEAKNYDFTEYVSGKLTVTKAPLTVTAKNAGRKVGEANPTFELEYSGFKNGESESVLTTKPVATTTATADSPAGEYDITVSGGEAQNYDITYVPGKLTVSEKTLITITAKNVIRLYGEANPTFEYTVVGGAIEGTPSLTCEATVASNVGEYVIKVSKGSITTDANFVFVDGKLFVDRAPLTVTAKDASREEGQENPAFELEYSGWKNGETESVLTTKPVATTTATANSVAGDYAITVSGGAAQNYEFTYVSGKLTITAKIDDGVATIFAEDVQGPVYTLGGQRVEHPRKGRLYIVNGRKTIIK